MITTAAMMPLYWRLGIRLLILACVTIMAGGVMNILPWGGPTARAATALGIDTGQIFIPLVPGMVVGTIWVLFVAYRLGLHERVRLSLPGSHDLPEIAMTINYPSLAEQKERLHAHAGNILVVVGLIFAADIFTGILSGTKMVDAMANSMVHSHHCDHHRGDSAGWPVRAVGTTFYKWGSSRSASPPSRCQFSSFSVMGRSIKSTASHSDFVIG